MKKAATKKASNANYATPALEKGLDVIELLATQPGGMTKSEIARALDRTVSEIFRMLVCLERRGYIAQTRADEYALTLKLFQLVQEHPPTEHLIAKALPAMHRFAHQTQQSCHLGVIEDGRVVILAQVNAPTTVGFYVKLGSSVDIMDASTGYVILAHQLADLRQRTLEEWKSSTGKKLPDDLEQHLSRIRRKGYEERASYQVRGVTNLTFPVFDQHGSATGALTTPYIQHLESSIAQKEVVTMLAKIANEITLSIGGKFPSAS